MTRLSRRPLFLTALLASAGSLAACSSSGSNGTTNSGTTTAASTGSAAGTSGSGSGGTTGASTTGSSTGGTLPTLGSACTADPDVCLSVGLVCSASAVIGGTGVCIYPEAGQPCLTAAGCDPDAGTVGCYTVAAVGDGGPTNVCAPHCAQVSDCSDPTTTCAAVTGASGAAQACVTNDCAKANAPCDASAVGAQDGTCVSVSSKVPPICVENGAAATYAACDATRADAGDFLCQSENICFTASVLDGTLSGAGNCLPLCGGTAVCPSGSQCLSEGGQTGICLAACGVSDAGVDAGCPSQFSCTQFPGYGTICVPPALAGF